MKNLEMKIESLLSHFIVLVGENIAFMGFSILIHLKTVDAVFRRWKASAIISIFFGVFLHLAVYAIFIVSIITKSSFTITDLSVSTILVSFATLSIVFGELITMPCIIIGQFLIYFRLWQSGDRFVDKYWRNPKISYRENGDWPFLKF
jgi:hypothetical protein